MSWSVGMVTFPKYGKIKPVPNYQPGFYCIINFVGFYCGIFLGFTNTVWSSISWVCMRKPSNNAAISVEKSSRYYLWGMWREPAPLIKLYCKLMLSKHGDLGQSQYVTVELMMTMPKNILPASQVFFGTPLEFDQMATGKTPEKLDTHSDTHSSGISGLEISNHSPQPAEPEPSSDLHPYHCGGHTNEHPAPSGPRLVSTTDGRPQGQHG